MWNGKEMTWKVKIFSFFFFVLSEIHRATAGRSNSLHIHRNRCINVCTWILGILWCTERKSMSVVIGKFHSNLLTLAVRWLHLSGPWHFCNAYTVSCGIFLYYIWVPGGGQFWRKKIFGYFFYKFWKLICF